MPEPLADKYADSAMDVCEANVKAALSKNPIGDIETVKSDDEFLMSTETLNTDFPLFASSLLNLIQNSENKINKKNAL